MDKLTGKSFEQSSSDIKNIIITLVGKKELFNVFITDKNGKEYKAIKCVLTDESIEINKNMISEELEHDISLEYTNISKIEDKINHLVIFEDISE